VRRRTIAIIAAVVLALAAAGLVVWYVSSLRNEETVAEPTQVVLVATADLPARATGEEIVANNLIERKTVVISSVAPGALSNESQLQGTVLTVPVAKGQQILQSQLGAPDEQSLSYRIKTGMRAVSIAVDRRNAVGGAIKEGDRVDVIATFEAGEFSAVQMIPPTTSSTEPPRGTTGSTTSTTISMTPMGLGMVLAPAEIARIKALTGFDLTPTVSNVSITILQQVDVLGIDILLPQTTQSTGGGVLSGGNKTTTEDVPDSPVITLMLSPADAEKIVYAQTFGKITFTLVPAQDTTKVDTTGRALPNMFR
jgi:pilus assembly protein CpaB